MPAEFTATARPLTSTGLERIASGLQIGLPALWAVLTVETKGCGFLPDRRPVILFERHIFHRRTGGRFSASHPEVSQARAGGYGASGDWQYQRLAEALSLDRQAALESASWGLGQVMGFNAKVVGFRDVEDMVAQMCESEDAQLQGVAGFVASAGLARALQRGDWVRFARTYNGEEFQKNRYDQKLALAHARYQAGPLPNLGVREAQLLLTYLGYRGVGTVDGWYGGNTQRALLAFQTEAGLPATGTTDAATMAALRARCGMGAGQGAPRARTARVPVRPR